jgi:hypothetical protein
VQGLRAEGKGSRAEVQGLRVKYMGISVVFLCALAALREVYFFLSSGFRFSLFDRVMGKSSNFAISLPANNFLGPSPLNLGPCSLVHYSRFSGISTCSPLRIFLIESISIFIIFAIFSSDIPFFRIIFTMEDNVL